MPELPEVEAARRAIDENCVGKRIRKAVIADDSKVIDGISAGEFEQSITGKTIVSAHRKGKNLWLQLDSPPFPSFQFGMAGAVYIKGVAVTQYKRSAVKDGDEWPSKYSKVFIELDDGMEFSFTDKRRFAKIRLLKDPTSVPPISELGPDALLEPMNVEEFVASLSKKKIAIKALLLDQSYISGIGNWIADEVLYQAKIHPLQTSSSLSKECCATLQKCIKEVMEKAVEVGADSIQYPNDWIFHNREKKPGKAFVDGKKIKFITAGGRTSAIVPELQKLSGDQAEKAANKQKKPNGRGKGRKNDSDDDKVNESEDDADDDGNAESESVNESTKLNKGKKKVVKAVKKKVLGRSNLKERDDEEDSAGDTKPMKGLKPKSQAKRKLPAKGKPHESDNEGNDDGTDDEEIQPKVEDSKKSKVQKTTVSRQGSRNLRKKSFGQ